ncbi:MAG: hypothetical protein H6672_10790 [Anaerolineaceae bacterium]|nr:hypothetical protein [Anaerolineaceae bacterium]
MSKRPLYIQLETGDDANSIRDRLSFLRGERVLLIWPEEGTIMTRKLDLVLIQREAMRRAIRLALVTHDSQVIRNATELNISTFETIGASERGRWQRGRSKVFTNRFQRPKHEPEAEELKEVATRIGDDEDTPGRKRRRWLTRLVILAVVAALLGGIAYVVVPTATIRLTPAQSVITQTVELVADPQAAGVDVENAVIRSTMLRVQVEETGTLETTGTQDLGAVPASGSVVFINQTNSGVNIPAGTVVSTSSGTPIQFRTTQSAELGAGTGLQIEVPIEAFQNQFGDAGNVESGLINTVIGPLANSVTVRNLAPTSGGENRVVRVVSQADKDRLMDTVRQQLQSRAFIEMRPRLSETQTIVFETIHIAEERADWTTFSANVGDVADTLTLTMQVVVEAEAIDQLLAQQVVLARLSQQIPRGRVLRPQSPVTYEMGPVSNIDSQGRITFNMTGSGLVTAEVDTELLKERLAGRPVEETLIYLTGELDLEQGTQPDILLTPDWIDRLPLLPSRITFVIQEAAQ